MTTHRGGSRERMLAATETLLRERGLAGAGIQHVVARSAAPIGSVYHFFPGGKTQLVSEALHLHAEKARALFQTMLGDRRRPLPERFRALCRTAAAGFDRAGANKGCAIGTVALDLDARHEALRHVCRAALDGWIATIAVELPWSDDATRRSFAEMAVAAIEGAFIVSRARRSGAPFLSVGEWLAAMLETSPPHASARRTRTRSGISKKTRR